MTDNGKTVLEKLIDELRAELSTTQLNCDMWHDRAEDMRNRLSVAQAENAKLREQVDAAHMSRLLTENENEKLLELVFGLKWCSENCGCESLCPLYDKSEPEHCREERLLRELGIEVDG